MRHKLTYLFSFFIFIGSLILLDRLTYSFRSSIATEPKLTASLAAELSQFAIPKNVLVPVILKSSVSKNREDYLQLKGKAEKLPERKVVQISEEVRQRNEVRKTDLGEVIYDFTYKFDAFNRRLSPNQSELRPSSIGVVFVGCSFIFGTGLQDNQTLPFYFSEKFKDIPVWNLGSPGVSANDILDELTNSRAQERYHFPVKKIVVVYGFIDEHLHRISCSSVCLGDDERYLKKSKYELINQVLVKQGTFADTYGPWSFLVQPFYNLTKTDGLFILHNNMQDPDNLQIYKQILVEIKKKLSEQYEVVGAYHLYLNNYLDYQMVNNIEQTKPVSEFHPLILRLEELDSLLPREALYIPKDGHPTAFKNQLVAEALAYRFKKDHPEIFKNERRP